jgi:RHS repeat-associated protein
MRNSSFFQKFIGVFLTLVFISPDALALTNTILNPVTFVQHSDAKWDTYLEGLPMGWKDDHTAYLGVSSNDALGKPSDDVFEFYISEAELAAKSFELSFSVSGVDDADATPVVINGQSSYGNVTQQAKQGWQRGSMTIMSDQLVAGRNTVLFTLPEGVNQVSVKQVSLTPKPGVAMPTRPMVLTEAISQDFNAVLSSGYYANIGNEEATSLAKLPSYALSKSQVASIPASFTNLTRGAIAYRVLGHRDSITHVTIGVDPSVGYNRLREVKVFYFDYDMKEWAQAHVSKVNHASYTLEADGEGGTDYFAAMIKTPDMPEAGALMPTSISDLEPANPATGINLIQPPTANQQGDANISYPISIPPGRQGMQPQVSLNYSSSGGSGWAGYGWSVPVQSISVDTRFGVPTFDATLQSEVYLFNGESLHEEDGKKSNRPTVSGSTVTYPTRDAGRQFYFTKQMSAYRTIERKKANAKSYFWIVTDANGTKSYYGTLDGVNQDNNSVLETGAGYTTKWYLRKVEDRFGNNILYTYTHINHGNTGDITNDGETVYLSKIQYTGFGSAVGKYEVEFITSGSRADARVSMNSGVKEVDDRQLTKIEVKYDGTLIKDYRLSYTTGDFGKELLEKVGEYHGGTLFYEHTMNYNTVGGITYQATPDTISFFEYGNPFDFSDMEWPYIKKNLAALMTPSLLKTTQTGGWTAGGALGVGVGPNPIPLMPDKTFTLSGKLSYSENFSVDNCSFQDVNGDGLPDLVWSNKSQTMFFFRPLSNENGQLKFGGTRRILGGLLTLNQSSQLNYGADFVLPLSVYSYGVNWNRSTSVSDRYLMDYNGDGILDRVVPNGSGHTVLFGVITPEGDLSFQSSSENTLNPVIKQNSLASYTGGSKKKYEVVKTWIAPASGSITISSNPSNVSGSSGDAMVSIQKNSTFLQAPVSVGSTPYNSTIPVTKGDTLSFRLNPHTSGYNDYFTWNPSVSYVSTLPSDGNSSDYSSSNYASSFMLSGREGISFAGSDEIKVTLNRAGLGFSDDLYYRIVIDATDLNGNVTRQKFVNRVEQNATSFTGFNDPFVGNYSTIPNVAGSDTCVMTLELFAHSNIDWQDISFRPKVEIKTDCDDNPIEIYPNVDFGVYNHVKQLEGWNSLSLPSGYHEISPEVGENKSAITTVFGGIAGEDIDQIVYFVAKSGGKTISKKALVLHLDASGQNSNSLVLKTLGQTTGGLGNMVNPVTYTGSGAATFSHTEVVNDQVYLEFYAERSPFASAALDYVKNNLAQFNVLNSSSSIVHVFGPTDNMNMFYGEDGPLNSHVHGWGQFAWSGDYGVAINTSEMEVPGTSLANNQIEPYDQSSLPKGSMEGVNPWDNSFAMMNPVRGENSVGLRSYLEAGMTTYSQRDHWAVFSTYMGSYRDGGESVPGYLGEREQPSAVASTPSSVYAAYGASRINESFSKNENVSNPAMFGISASSSVSGSNYFGHAVSSFQDFNGDGYADRVLESGGDLTVQYTNSSGGHKSSISILQNENATKTISNNTGFTKNGSFANEDIRFAKMDGKATLTGNGGVNFGSSYEEIEFVDVNGDGLVDRVINDGTKQVRLNNGYGFDPALSLVIPTSSFNTASNDSKSFGLGIGSKLEKLKKGNTVLAFSLSVGLGMNNVGSNSTSMAIDLNGDGMNDLLRVVGSDVNAYINTGTDFVLHQDQGATVDLGLKDKPNQSQALGLNANVGATLGMVLAPFVKMSISGNGGLNYSINKLRSSFMDINGDGAVDFVTAEENGDMLVYYSNVQKSNLLTRVSNPLGGSFDISYDLEGRKTGVHDVQVQTHRSGEQIVWDMPQAKWVMSEVTIDDGVDMVTDKQSDDPDIDLDGADQVTVYFAYDGGIHNRREKAFSGFTRVETKQQNQLTSNERFLTEVVEYFGPDEISFEEIKKHDYLKGLVRNTYALLHDNSSGSNVVSLISQQNSSYEFRMVDISSSSIAGDSIGQVKKNSNGWIQADWSTIDESSTIFPAVVVSEALNYPQITNSNYHSQEFELKYDSLFNVLEYRDKADMIPGVPAEVIVDTINSVKVLSYTQKDSCLNLPSTPDITQAGLKGYIIDAKLSGYSSDTLWMVDVSGNCPTDDVFGQDYCSGGDNGTFVTHHFKEVVQTSYVKKTISDANYSSDRVAVMTYFAKGDAAGRTNVLETHRIYDGSVQAPDLVRESKVSALTTDDKSVATIEMKLNATDYAVTDLEYDTYGNVTKVTGAENSIGQRAYTIYGYDTDVHQYIENITNQFGESVCNIYDKATGQLQQTVGIGGQAMAYEYDSFDRLEHVWAPREINITGSAPTISYSYDLSGAVAKATTTHNLGNTSYTAVNNVAKSCVLVDLTSRPAITSGVSTVTFVDGTAKAIQLQTQQSLVSGGINTNSFIVSGVQTLDKFGRGTQQYADVAGPSTGTFGTFYIHDDYVSDDLIQQNVTYDYNNRLLSQETWSGEDGSSTGQWTTTTMEYNWNTDLGGSDHVYYEKTWVKSSTGSGTTTPDVESATYTDSRGRKVGQITYGATSSDNIITGFAYNNIGELTSVTDPIGLVTNYTYDIAGRVLTEDHPDRGLTETTYDKASNVTFLSTPGTIPFGGGITMNYHYNRLSSKRMPGSNGSDLYDVDYTYGTTGNETGRIIEINQGAGFKIDMYLYDELGNVISEDVSMNLPIHGVKNFTTSKAYDSFGRIIQAVYPDGDKVDYAYTGLGELYSIKSTVGGVTEDIVTKTLYNGSGQIEKLVYGNGTETEYEYLSTNGSSLKTGTLFNATVYGKEQGGTSNTTLLERDYTYNKQGMVSQLDRNVAGSLVGGSTGTLQAFTDNYSYDRFGRFEQNIHKKGSTTTYLLDMSYNKAGGITQKNASVANVTNGAALHYNLNYSYSPSKPHQLDNVIDQISASQSTYQYNSAGSIKEIQDPMAGGPQTFYWNEEQWLSGVSNDLGVHHYVYDHKGERIMKSSVLQSSVQVNDQTIDDVQYLDPYTLYINPYYVVTELQGGDKISKHYYMNTQRVATDISINYQGPTPVTGPVAPGGVDPTKPSADKSSASYNAAFADLQATLEALGHPKLDVEALGAQPTLEGYYPELLSGSAQAAPMAKGALESTSRVLFWYHPDYLGNVDLVTERDGKTYEFFTYNPWGEEMHQYNANTFGFSSPYRFNSKEKDAETGLYYYGARYYDPKVSIWLSVDPKAHWYPGHSPYNFSLNNPINLVDPNGQWVEGAGFWNNLFYSDKRNEAMLMAGENGSFEKTDDGWRVTRSNQSSSDNQGDFQGEMLNEVEIIELKDDGERSIDDHAANMVRGVANTGIIVGTALAMPFVALAKNKNIDWEAGDKYTSANPYQLSEDVGFEQMNGSTKEVGKEVMKNTVGLILSFVPGVAGASTLDKAKKSGATSAIKQGVNKAIDEIDD